MTEPQYTIGTFAAINKITPRRLRHYDKIGLLKPAALLDNGYRTYTSAQIETVSNIHRYQSCGFTLSEISVLLAAEPSAVQQAAKRKLTELDQSDKTQQVAREQLLTLARDAPNAYTNHYDISYVQQGEQRLFCCAAPVAERDVEAAFKRLYQALAAQGGAPDGFCLLLSDLETADAYSVAVPVNNDYAWGYPCISLKAGWYLSTLHHGDYCSLGMAYDRLMRFAAEQGYLLQPPFLERSLLDEETASSPTRYLTQILVRLTP